MVNNTESITKGDIFSENSKYIFQSKIGNEFKFTHYPSMKTVSIEGGYVEDHFFSGQAFDSVVNVTKEDKKDGTKGIRSIFSELGDVVFTVAYRKIPKELSDKKFNELKETQVKSLLERIKKAQESKKGVLAEAELCLKELQENNIQQVEKGELRVLKGYKKQFHSNDGKYDCIDLELPDGPEKLNIRSVNINTIEYLIVNNTKFVVK